MEWNPRCACKNANNTTHIQKNHEMPGARPKNRHGFAAFEFPVLIILSIQSLKQPEICCLNPGEFFLLPFLSCSMVHYRKNWAGAVMLWMGCR